MQSVSRPAVLWSGFVLALVAGLGRWVLTPSKGSDATTASLDTRNESAEEPSPFGQGAALRPLQDPLRSGMREVTPSSTGAPESDKRWKGRIVDRTFAWPIPGAQVLCRVGGQEVAHAQTDAQGTFELDATALAAWREEQGELEIRGTYLAEVTTVQLRTLDFLREIALPVPGLLHIHGRVRPAFDCALWEGHSTLISTSEERTSKVLASSKWADDGAFEAWLLAADLLGECQIVLQHPEHPTDQRKLVVSGVDVSLGTAALKAGRSLHGRVLAELPEDLRSRQLWVEWCGPEALVLEAGSGDMVRCGEIWEQRIRSVAIDGEGSFVARGLRDGCYRLCLVPPGAQGLLFAPEVQALHVTEVQVGESNEPVVLEEWWSLVEVEAKLPKEAGPLFSLGLLGSSADDPYPQAHVLLDAVTQRGWLAVEPMRRVSIRVQDSGTLLAAPLEVPAIQKGHWSPATVSMVQTQRAALDVRLVVQDPLGQSLADAAIRNEVRLGFAIQRQRQSGSWEVYTDYREECDGAAYILRNFAEGRYRIELRAIRNSDVALGWVPIIAEWNLSPDGNPVRELRFQQGGFVVLHGQNAEGAPLDRHFCELLDVHGQPIATRFLKETTDRGSAEVNLYQGQTNLEGDWRCHWPVPSGSYLARISSGSNGASAVEKIFEVLEGQTTRVQLEVN